MSSRRSLIVLGGIVFLALALRIVVMILFRSYEIPPDADHWNFAYEAGRIARSLATGHGFSSPLVDPSGPSAFLPLGYPLLLSWIFRLFGSYSTHAAVATYLVNCAFSALTCVALYVLGERLFGRDTGLIAAACLALYPPSIWHAVSTIWDTSLLGLCTVGLMAWLYGLPARPTTAQLARTGLLMGVVALINPVPLLFYPAVALILWKHLRDEGSSGYREIVVLTGSCMLICVPWMVRNAVQVGEFTPRNGAGINFRLGNTDKAWQAGVGGQDISVYPTISDEEGRLFHAMGETRYDRYCARLTIDYIRSHPGRFAELTLMRIRAWWLGQNTDWPGNFKVAFRLAALKRFAYLLPLPFFVAGCIAAWLNRVRAGLLWALLAIYPIPYYLTFVAERYHFPVEPFLLLVGSYGMIQIWEWPGWRQRSRASWNSAVAGS